MSESNKGGEITNEYPDEMKEEESLEDENNFILMPRRLRKAKANPFPIESIEAIKDLADFMVKTSGQGIIVFGVNYDIMQIPHPNQGQQRRNQQQVLTEAMLNLIKSETEKCTEVVKWIELHKTDQINSVDRDATLESFFNLNREETFSYTGSEPPWKEANGRLSWEVNTFDDVRRLLTSSEEYLTAMENVRCMAESLVQEFPSLQFFPITQRDIDNIKRDIDNVKTTQIY